MDTSARDNLWALFEGMCDLPGCVSGSCGSAHWHHAPFVNPMFCGVWGAETVEDGLAALDTLTERGAPLIFVWLAEGARPDGLAVALAARGAVPFEIDAPTLVADLDRLDWSALDRAPDGFSIVRLTDDGRLEDFARAFNRGLGVPDWAGTSWAAYFRAHGTGGRIVPYLGLLGDEAVATNMLFCGGGVASVYGVATVPEARGQGIGAAITLAPFRDAKAAGWERAVLFATELGVPVYRRIGFEETGATVSRYLWMRPGVSLA